jgi:hypothetical protein
MSAAGELPAAAAGAGSEGDGQVTVNMVMQSRVSKATRDNYTRDAVAFLMWVAVNKPELLTVAIVELFPLPWEIAKKPNLITHLLGAPDTCAPLQWEAVTGRHVLRKNAWSIFQGGFLL